MAEPRSEPSRRPLTVIICCRFSRRISFCGGCSVTWASDPSEAVWPELELKTVFWMESSEARVASGRRTRMV